MRVCQMSDIKLTEGDGRVLQVESLETVMKQVTFQMNTLKGSGLWYRNGASISSRHPAPEWKHLDMEGVGGGAPIQGTDEISCMLHALVNCRIIRGFARYGTDLYLDARPYNEHS